MKDRFKSFAVDQWFSKFFFIFPLYKPKHCHFIPNNSHKKDKCKISHCLENIPGFF